MRRISTLLVAVAFSAVLASGVAPASDRHLEATRQAHAAGAGGAVATVDAHATAAALGVLRRGGNAIDGAVAAAAVLGVTEPFSCGIGGGGFLVAWLAREGRAVTIDHRETAPAAFDPDAFIDPETGQPYEHSTLVTSGLAVGVPGTVAGWAEALRRYGTLTLAEALRPAIDVARRGFTVDQTFHDQVEANRDRFDDFTSTRALFLTDDGEAPPVGSRFVNRDLAGTLERLARRGPRGFYRGAVAADIVESVRHPPVVDGVDRRVLPGRMTAADLARYEAVARPAVRVGYRGYDVIGMGPPSSGASTVGEALNILEGFDLAGLGRPAALHRVLEASRLAFADRNAYLGDPDHADVPLDGLLSDGFAAERRDRIGERAAAGPVPPGDPYRHEGRPAPAGRAGAGAYSSGASSTTHLTVSDRHGNVVSYTYTIEQIGGSGMAVPGRGFLLNNELTDFEAAPPHPNAPDGGKRPRSSMAPTIVLRDGQPVLALGSPGGAAIITTVLGLLVDVLDFDLPLREALAAPRASQRNTEETSAEPAFVDSDAAAFLHGLGHRFTEVPEIGAATGIAFLPGGRVEAVAEPSRRGGGSAGVEKPARQEKAA